MKHKRLFILFFLLAFISIGTFSIYKTAYKQELNYVALGDSVAAGRNPYGVDDYGYTDYVRDYLKANKKLSSYVSYAVSGYTTLDVANDINLNKSIKVNGSLVNIRKALRESNLVTISIGANDFMHNINLSSLPSVLSDTDAAIKQVDETIEKVNELLSLIKKYAKGHILVIGYYNPLPRIERYKDNINKIVQYADKMYDSICVKSGVIYVKVSDIISKDDDYLPNPLDIHPSKEGYLVISDEIIKYLKTNVLK